MVGHVGHTAAPLHTPPPSSPGYSSSSVRAHHVYRDLCTGRSTAQRRGRPARREAREKRRINWCLQKLFGDSVTGHTCKFRGCEQRGLSNCRREHEPRESCVQLCRRGGQCVRGPPAAPATAWAARRAAVHICTPYYLHKQKPRQTRWGNTSKTHNHRQGRRILLELPLPVIQRADLACLQPSGDAVEVESVLFGEGRAGQLCAQTTTPCHRGRRARAHGPNAPTRRTQPVPSRPPSRARPTPNPTPGVTGGASLRDSGRPRWLADCLSMSQRQQRMDAGSEVGRGVRCTLPRRRCIRHSWRTPGWPGTRCLQGQGGGGVGMGVSGGACAFAKGSTARDGGPPLQARHTVWRGLKRRRAGGHRQRSTYTSP